MDKNWYYSLIIQSKLTYKTNNQTNKPAQTESKKIMFSWLCTLYIPYICQHRNVYYLWEFIGLQTPMKLKWPWQPQGCWERYWDIFISTSFLIPPQTDSMLFPQKSASGTISKLLHPASQDCSSWIHLSHVLSQHIEIGQQMLQLAFLRLVNFLWAPKENDAPRGGGTSKPSEGSQRD